MSQPASARQLIRFGVFELDVSAGELRRRKVHLQQQPLQVLTLLLGRPGEVVTREELQQELWPGDTFVEFDQGLNTAIKKIRRALGDSADNPRFVETLPRKGYRFIAPVTAEAAGAATSASAKSTVGRRPLPAAVAALVLAVVAGAGWVFSRDGKTPEVAPVPVPLTSDLGSESSPSFSPDGSQVVFDWERPGGGFEIRLKRVGDGTSRFLANGCCPAWSPDGRAIAFLEIRRSLSSPTEVETDVQLVSPLGGPPGDLTRLHVDYFPGLFHGIAWHPTGKWLIVTDKESPERPGALFVISSQDGGKRRLTTPPEGSFDTHPALSPDGRALVFARFGSMTSFYLNLLELSEELEPQGELKQLTARNTFSGEPVWTPDGRAIVYLSGLIHGPALYKMEISRPGLLPGTPKRLAFGGHGVRKPAVSGDGKLAYSTCNWFADIWRLKLDDIARAAGPATRLISSTRLDHVPQYSPDGKRIAFASNRSGSNEIYVSNIEGLEVTKLTSFGGPMYTANPVWSPDSRMIAFTSNPEGHQSTYVVNANGGDPELVFGDGVATGWSRDGKWVYVVANGQVWKKPWPPLRENQAGIELGLTGVSLARESPDGKFLYYLKATEENGLFASLWRTPLDGGEQTLLVESVCCHSFAATDDGIYFIPEWSLDDQASIQYLSFATGKVTKVVGLDHPPAFRFSLSPDGRSLLFAKFMDEPCDLWMVEDFR